MNLNELIQPEKPNPEPTHFRIAVLWGQEDLLAQAVGLLLESNTSWKVVRVSSADGIEKLTQKIRNVSPDVVILCQDKFDANSVLPAQLIHEQLCRKVVTVGLENNLMQIYSKHDVTISGVSDLMSVIETNHFLDHGTQ